MIERRARRIAGGDEPRPYRIDGCVAEILGRAVAARPEECCGVLLGRGCEVMEVVATRNCAEDRCRRYAIDPEELLAIDRDARSRSLEIVGYYHSHPAGAPEPSATDLEAAWPDSLYLIAGRTAGGEWELRGWRLSPCGGRFEPVSLETRGG